MDNGAVCTRVLGASEEWSEARVFSFKDPVAAPVNFMCRKIGAAISLNGACWQPVAVQLEHVIFNV